MKKINKKLLCTSQEPDGKKTRKGRTVSDVGEKHPHNYSKEKSTQSGTGTKQNNPCRPSSVIRTWVLEVEGEERQHFDKPERPLVAMWFTYPWDSWFSFTSNGTVHTNVTIYTLGREKKGKEQFNNC